MGGADSREEAPAPEEEKKAGAPSGARSSFGWLCRNVPFGEVAYRNISLTVPQLAFSVAVVGHQPSRLNT